MIGNKRIAAIVPAAGTGKRMQSAGYTMSKQFVSIGHLPILAHTVAKLESSEAIDDIIIVCEKERVDHVATEIVDACRFTKIRRIVAGGKERQDSVFAGFQACPSADFVLIHDGVRPFISQTKIREVLDSAVLHRAAILAVQAKDTIKAQDEQQFVERTLDRSVLWSVQTPQVFEYDLLKQAFETAFRDNYYATDESALVEAIGHRVKIVPGDYDNIKITSPEDVVIAEAILERLGASS